jgi:deoxyadenosine/deoxycytidine kinase
VAIVGPIAAGKSTLVKALAVELDAVALPERIDDAPFFARFLESPTRWAFQHTVFFIEQCVRDRETAQSSEVGAVQERVVEEHVNVFAAEFHARGYLTDDEWELIRRLGETCVRLLRPVDLLVYLEIPVDESLRRITARGRHEERDVTVGYLRALEARYVELVGRWSPDRVLPVDSTRFDFRRREDVKRIADAVRASLGRGDRYANPVAGTTRLGQRHPRPDT